MGQWLSDVCAMFEECCAAVRVAHDSHTLLWHVGELGFAGDVWDPCLAETVILLYMKIERQTEDGS